MEFILQPWQLFLTILAGLINRQQHEVIEYLRTENQVLKETHGKKRIRLNDDQRRRLAVKGKVLGRKILGEIETNVTPDTIMRWHRQLVAEKWDYSERRKPVGRPRAEKEIVELVLRMARDNSSWGYDRIQGALANLGRRISDTTGNGDSTVFIRILLPSRGERHGSVRGPPQGGMAGDGARAWPCRRQPP
jgi:hypothetical protein